jgi:hypothetical protein
MRKRSIIIDTAAWRPVMVSGDELVDPAEPTHMALTAFLATAGLAVSLAELPRIGNALEAETGRRGLQVRQVPDTRYGRVNAYPTEVLKDYFRVK